MIMVSSEAMVRVKRGTCLVFDGSGMRAYRKNCSMMSKPLFAVKVSSMRRRWPRVSFKPRRRWAARSALMGRIWPAAMACSSSLRKGAHRDFKHSAALSARCLSSPPSISLVWFSMPM